MASLVRRFTALVFGTIMTASFAHAGDVSPTITVGTQEVGLTAGYMLSHRLTYLHKTQQHGPALMPSWMITLTDPVGDGWYRGQVSLGAEMVYLEFREPLLTHGIGFTPRIKYTFVALGRLRPYAEFTGGPFWTDLGGRVREQANRIQFHACQVAWVCHGSSRRRPPSMSVTASITFLMPVQPFRILV